MQRRHRVVVIGAGFGGLAVLKSLAKVPVDLVMIERNNFHTFQPLLYQVATAGLDSDDIAYPLRGIASHRNTQTQVRTHCRYVRTFCDSSSGPRSTRPWSNPAV